ncbi:cell envelope integrity protein TolA [Endozoicomonas sp. SCSIO W0465]|uniref:cell envelope integrity protein TolA n=1 Tax=Endozoicomonas sp. SCSIO W0465 TaxID=2918516 RepID=UPI002074E0C6|nr:cell envelope integrity protein TolA [Endozoicomonas sp. SCSIO W0465]USE34480.1 cell envelope integrity protein TolA [Endozoicomonas sp. SCSIO W0465]
MMFGVLLVNWSTDSNPEIVPPMPISAALVELPKPAAKPQTVRQPSQTQAEQKRKEEARKRAEAKKIAEEKRKKAEQQRKEQERQKALALKREKERKQEEERKKEALRKKEEAARELQEQARRQREKEQKHKEQQLREQALAMERQALEAAQQLEHDQLQQAKYSALIKSLTSQYWNRPPSARNNMVAEIRISLSPFGDVLDIVMVKSSGNDEFDRSVIQAIRRASPFSELKDLDRRIFDQYFRRITFRFRPEDLVK